MKGRKAVRVDVSKGKSITEVMTVRKQAGKKGTTTKSDRGKSQRPGRCKTEELL